MSMSDYVGFIKGTGIRTPRIHRLPCPDCLHCSLGLTYPECDMRCFQLGVENLEKESTGSIAAFMVEPVLGSGGCIIPPDGYFAKVRELCDRYKALLIADEAQTGLGRTGRWWGMEHWGVVPDILVLSKGLGNGFPVAAVVTRADIEQKCINAPLANMSSHSFDPFGAAVALEVIETLRDEGLVEKAEKLGEYFLKVLGQVAEQHVILAAPRGRGLMLGVDVVSRDGNGQLDPMLSLGLEAECLMNGVVLGYSALSGVMRLLPPVVITTGQVDQAMDLLDKAAGYLEEKGVDVSRYMPSHNGSAMLAISFLRKLMGR